MTSARNGFRLAKAMSGRLTVAFAASGALEGPGERRGVAQLHPHNGTTLRGQQAFWRPKGRPQPFS
jgi:hypothetical protein